MNFILVFERRRQYLMLRFVVTDAGLDLLNLLVAAHATTRNEATLAARNLLHGERNSRARVDHLVDIPVQKVLLAVLHLRHRACHRLTDVHLVGRRRCQCVRQF